jgi:hypothetical protein
VYELGNCTETLPAVFQIKNKNKTLVASQRYEVKYK